MTLDRMQAVLLEDQLKRAQKALLVAAAETDALRSVAVTNLRELEEARAEIVSLRDAIKQLTADVAHYMAYGPSVPAFPKAMVEHADG